MNISDHMGRHEDDMVIDMRCIFNKREVPLRMGEEVVKGVPCSTYSLMINKYHCSRVLAPKDIKRANAIAKYEEFCDKCMWIHPYAEDFCGVLLDDTGEIVRGYEIHLNMDKGIALLTVIDPIEDMAMHMEFDDTDFMPQAPTTPKAVEVFCDMFLDQQIRPSELFLYPNKKEIIKLANERMTPHGDSYIYCLKERPE